MSSDKKYTVLEHPSRLANILTASSNSAHPHHNADATSTNLLELNLDGSGLSYTQISDSHSPHHHQHHVHAPHSLSATSNGHHHHQYTVHSMMNQVAMLEHLPPTTLTSGAPSPPDSSTSSPDFSMSSSPIPPNLVPVSSDRVPDSGHHILTPAELVQGDYQAANAQQSIHHFHHHLTPSRTYLRIVEQPTNRIRYRYKSEKGSHGGLTGESSTPTKKTYPTVKLENVRQSGHFVVKASLVTNEDHPRPHVHKLMGRHCNEEGICIVQLGENDTAVFQNLGILFVGKKEVPEILYQRKLEEHRQMFRSHHHHSLQLSDADNQRLREEAEREAKDMNLNCVKIAFQAFEYNQNSMSYPICEPVYSRSVANQKSPDSGELKIVRMDRYSGLCTGDEEVFLLCEKVNKKEIKIRFFETDSQGNHIWEAFANFTEADVHHQVAIVFRTPPYRDTDLEEYVQVYLQLYRPKDSEYSEPRPFTYCPRMQDKACVGDAKRKKASPPPSTNTDHLLRSYSVSSMSGESSLVYHYSQT